MRVNSIGVTVNEVKKPRLKNEILTMSQDKIKPTRLLVLNTVLAFTCLIQASFDFKWNLPSHEHPHVSEEFHIWGITLLSNTYIILLCFYLLLSLYCTYKWFEMSALYALFTSHFLIGGCFAYIVPVETVLYQHPELFPRVQSVVFYIQLVLLYACSWKISLLVDLESWMEESRISNSIKANSHS